MDQGLRPFFNYYGGKWRSAPYYPAPRHPHIIEPFAGSAGYALRYPEKAVTLYDINPVIAGPWKYLIHVSESEIRQLPVDVKHVDDHKICQEAKWFIGFYLNKSHPTPCLSPPSWMRSGLYDNNFWGSNIRERIASQLYAIRHWKVFNLHYHMIPNTTATWFIDPPYNNEAGRRYPYGIFHYKTLATWCQNRQGQVMVCEQEGATWLPFREFRTTLATIGHSQEAIWTKYVSPEKSQSLVLPTDGLCDLSGCAGEEDYPGHGT